MERVVTQPKERLKALHHLGLAVGAKRLLLLAPPARLSFGNQVVEVTLKQIRNHQRWVKGHQLLSLCGRPMSLCLAMPLARFHTREMLRDRRSKARKRGFDSLCHTQNKALKENSNQRRSGKSYMATNTIVSPALRPQPARVGKAAASTERGLFTAEATQLRINTKDMRAVTQTLQPLCHLAPSRRMQCAADGQR